MRPGTKLIALLALLVVASWPISASGYQWYTWDGTNNWNSSSNWSPPGTPPSGVDTGALIRSGTVTIDATTPSGNTNAVLVAWNGSANLTMNGGSLTVTGAGGDQTLAIAESGNAIFTQNGGTVTTNRVDFNRWAAGFTGTYSLNGGVLQTGVIYKSVAGTANLNLNSGTLQATANGGAWLGAGINVNVQAGGAIIDTQGFDVTVNSGLLDGGGGGGLTKLGSGVLRIAGATYTGTTTLDQGYLVLNQSLTLGGVVSFGTAGAYRRLDLVPGNTQAFGGLVSPADANTDVYTDSGTPASLVLNVASGSFSYGGTLGIHGNTFSLTKNGAGTQILTGSSTYTGGTTVNGGTLQIGNGENLNSVGAGSYSVAPGAKLVFNRNCVPTDFTTQSISGGGDIEFRGQQDGYFRFAGYTGTLSYTGRTIVNLDDNPGNQWYQGVLWLEKDNVLPNSTVLDMQSGKIYLRNSGTLGQTVAGLTGNAGTFITTDQGVQKLTVNVPTGQTYTYAGVIGADGTGVGNDNESLTQSGPGTQILTGPNTYTGGTTVSGGKLQVGVGGTTGWIAGNATVSLGADLAFNRSDDVTFPGLITGAGRLVQMGPGKLTLTQDAQGTAKVETGTTLQLGNSTDNGWVVGNIENNGTLIYSRNLDVFYATGVISGTGNLIQRGGTTVEGAGCGVLRLRTQNTYQGTTSVETGYLVTDAVDNALPITTVLSFPTVAPASGKARWDMSGKNQELAGLSGGTGGTNGDLYSTGSPTLTLNTPTGQTFTYGGQIGYAVGQRNIAVVKNGPGTQILTGNNLYTGGTTISGGTLQIGNNDAGARLGGAVTLANNANLTLYQNYDWTGGNDFAGLAVTGAGSLTLLGQSTGYYTTRNTQPFTYTGGTRINLDSGGAGYQGSLYIEGTGTLPSTTVLNLEAGKIYLRKNQTLGGLQGAATGGGVYGNAGAPVLEINVASGSYSYGGILVDSGSALALTKSGPGTQILTSDNTYTGVTTVTGGTLQIGDGGTAGALPIAGSVTVTSPGNLAFNRSDTVMFAGSVTGTGTVTQAGLGTLILTAPNLSTGGLASASRGVMQIGSGIGAAPLGNGNYSVASGAKLVFNGNSDSNLFTVQSISGDGDVEFRGQQTGYFAFRSPAGPGPYVGSLTYTGRTIVNLDDAAGNVWWQGTLWLEKDDVLPHATVLDIQSGKVYMRGSGTLGQTVAGLAGNAGTFITTDQGSIQKLTVDVPTGQTYTYAGVIGADGSGVGNNNISLTKSGPGTQVFTFNSAPAGGTTVSGGTLQLGNNTIHGWLTGTITLANGATLAYYRSDNTVFSAGTGLADIVGTGNVSFQGAQTSYYTLQEAWHYTGTTTVNLADGGWATLYVESTGSLPTTTDVNLTAGNINLRNSQSWKGLAGSAGTFLTWDTGGTGTLTLNVDNGKSFTYAGQIRNTAGTLSLVKDGPGTQVLTGVSTYTGGTTISAGTLRVDGSLAGAVTVNGGWLTGGGSVGAVTINADGAVSAGQAPGTLTVIGNYTQSGTMLAELGGPLQGQAVNGYDWISVSGTAGLSAGATVDVNLVGGYFPQEGTVFDILTAGGGITNADLSGIVFDFKDAQPGRITWVASIYDLNGQPGGAEALRLQAVPEPATMVLLSLAMAGLVRHARRRRLA